MASKTKKEILAEVESIIDSHCECLPFHDLVDFDLNLKFKDNSNVQILNYAISNSIGTTTLYINKLCHSLATCSKEFVNEKRHEYLEERIVKTTTLKQIFLENNITEKDKTYIKIDVENYEREVLSTLPFLPYLFSFEIHADKREKIFDCLAKINEFNENYDCNILINRHFVFKKFVPIVKLLDCVFEKNWRKRNECKNY
ncbi:MAG: FkbM family methyltransferase [Candidatus Heimdallarchaeota archaeon]